MGSSGSISIDIEPLPLLPTIDETTKTSFDAPKTDCHPLLRECNSLRANKKEPKEEYPKQEVREELPKHHRRGDTYEPLPFHHDPKFEEKHSIPSTCNGYPSTSCNDSSRSHQCYGQDPTSIDSCGHYYMQQYGQSPYPYGNQSQHLYQSDRCYVSSHLQSSPVATEEPVSTGYHRKVPSLVTPLRFDAPTFDDNTPVQHSYSDFTPPTLPHMNNQQCSYGPYIAQGTSSGQQHTGIAVQEATYREEDYWRAYPLPHYRGSDPYHHAGAHTEYHNNGDYYQQHSTQQHQPPVHESSTSHPQPLYHSYTSPGSTVVKPQNNQYHAPRAESEDTPKQNEETESIEVEIPREKLVRFQQMMKLSEESQSRLEQWDKEMGLRRSHSKTMWESDRSRRDLQNATLHLQKLDLRKRHETAIGLLEMKSQTNERAKSSLFCSLPGPPSHNTHYSSQA